jgi:hypothetical protein
MRRRSANEQRQAMECHHCEPPSGANVNSKNKELFTPNHWSEDGDDFRSELFQQLSDDNGDMAVSDLLPDGSVQPTSAVNRRKPTTRSGQQTIAPRNSATLNTPTAAPLGISSSNRNPLTVE